MENSPESVFQSELLKDEKIHWTGQPDSSSIFSPADWFMVPFSLMWGGFAIFWESTVLGLNPFLDTSKHRPPVFFALWGVPFVCIGLYMIFGRFFYKAWKRKRTYYAVTNQRVLQVAVTGRVQIQALFLNQTAAINKYVRSDGSGTLTFGNTGYYPFSYYANSGMDFLGSRYSQGIFAFYDIPEVDGVYRLVNQLRNPTT